MLSGEVDSELPEEILSKIRLTSDLYEPLHQLFKPSWAKDIKPKQNFYDGTPMKRPQAFINMVTGELIKTGFEGRSNYKQPHYQKESDLESLLRPDRGVDDSETNTNTYYDLSESDFDVEVSVPKEKKTETDNQKRIEEALRKL